MRGKRGPEEPGMGRRSSRPLAKNACKEKAKGPDILSGKPRPMCVGVSPPLSLNPGSSHSGCSRRVAPVLRPHVLRLSLTGGCDHAGLALSFSRIACLPPQFIVRRARRLRPPKRGEGLYSTDISRTFRHHSVKNTKWFAVM